MSSIGQRSLSSRRKSALKRKHTGEIGAYYKLLIHAWFDWDPSEKDLEEIGRRGALRDGALCTTREIVAIVDRPQDIEDEDAMSFFGGEEGDTELGES